MTGTKIRDEAIAQHPPLVGGLTGADDSENLSSLEIDIALVEKNRGRVGTLTESRRVGGIGVCQHLHAETVCLVNLGVSESKSRFTSLCDRLTDGVVGLGKVSSGGSEHIGCGAEMVD